jgi:hypothetical protein
MLFRTVYGPELGAIYLFIVDCNRKYMQPGRTDIYRAFIPTKGDGTRYSSQNVDDAINFLKSAGLLQDQKGEFTAGQHRDIPFPFLLLQTLRHLEVNCQTEILPADRLYLNLLTELYIKPNRVIVPDLHAAANQLPSVQEIGGLGKEKLQAWTRVMEYLGVGRRLQGNFMCIYSPDLILSIIKCWRHEQGTLQSFFEDYFDKTVPYSARNGELAQAVMIPLKELANRHLIELYPLQDSPTMPYFGRLRYRGISYKEYCND